MNIDRIRDGQSEPKIEAVLNARALRLTRHDLLTLIVNTATIIALIFVSSAAWNLVGLM